MVNFNEVKTHMNNLQKSNFSQIIITHSLTSPTDDADDNNNDVFTDDSYDTVVTILNV